MQLPEMLIVLMLSISVLALLARRLGVSPPVAFLLGGMLLGLMPGIPMLQARPEAMLVIFLPPLLMEAAYFTSLRDFRANLRLILQLAVGLVLATAAAISWVFTALMPGAGWALGFVLGAIVSPPDAVAATSLFKPGRMRVPRRIVTVLEGESLVNDATGLVLYQFAVAAVVTAHFSLADAAAQFLWMAILGPCIGYGIALLYARLFRYLKDISVEILTTFVVPYVAYIAAEAVHASGVLAVVTAGLAIGWRAPSLFTSAFRIPAEAVWRMVVFMLSATVFLLIGWQFPALLARLSRYDPLHLAGYALAVCLVAVWVRLVWVFAMSYGVRFLFPSIRRQDPYPAWQNVFIIAWTGMRGVVSLATALALPFTLADGSPFPHRDLIVFLAVSVIFFTLVVQGLTLPWLVRRLPLAYDPRILHEDWQARVEAARNALTRLEHIARNGDVHAPALERLRSHYCERLQSLGDGPNTPLVPSEDPIAAQHPLIQAEHRLWQETIATERETVVALRKGYVISDEVMHAILRELDLLASRFSVSG